MDLSVLILALNEEKNIPVLLGMLHEQLLAMKLTYEIVVIDGNSHDNTVRLAKEGGARVEIQKEKGYGAAFRQGLKICLGEYVLTIDADLSHEPNFIPEIWSARKKAELIIASRFIDKKHKFEASAYRVFLSKIGNRVFRRILSLPVSDLSSGFRLYNAKVLHGVQLEGKKFDVLPELLIKIYAAGYEITEIPFSYRSRTAGQSNFKLFIFLRSYLNTMWSMWKLRNSIASADYDYRAYYSCIPLQRYWQRRRYKIIKNMAGAKDLILDVGCGSCKVVLDSNAIGLDIARNKLRFNLKFNKNMVQGSVMDLPFKDNFFKIVVCSEVIEHIPENNKIFFELKRVLEDNGILILGAPDYESWQWPFIEYFYSKIADGGYAKEHITHYKKSKLVSSMKKMGFVLLEEKSILRAEIILKFRVNKKYEN